MSETQLPPAAPEPAAPERAAPDRAAPVRAVAAAGGEPSPNRPGSAPMLRGLPPVDLVASVIQRLAEREAELIAIRRDLHAHPELGRSEVRTTHVIDQRLRAAGLTPRILPAGTGLIVDIGVGAPAVALRADIDALPVTDLKVDRPYRSTIPGLCHACGHDVHTSALIGVALVLAEFAAEGILPQPVRLIFQPAEELLPGGSNEAISAGALLGIRRIFCLHVDPRLDTGQVGLRVGPITSACDRVEITLRGRGGHTARPHLTHDVVHALGTIVTGLPTALSRRLDPRAGVSLVWGRVQAGNAANAIPSVGVAEGTLRVLDVSAWKDAPAMVENLARMLAAPYGVQVEVKAERGVPPVVNDADCVAVLSEAAEAVLGAGSIQDTEQSLGAEDFGWYLEQVPGALVRLGVRRPGDSAIRDLHQGDFDPDEAAIIRGAGVLAVTALLSTG